MEINKVTNTYKIKDKSRKLIEKLTRPRKKTFVERTVFDTGVLRLEDFLKHLEGLQNLEIFGPIDVSQKMVGSVRYEGYGRSSDEEESLFRTNREYLPEQHGEYLGRGNFRVNTESTKTIVNLEELKD